MRASIAYLHQRLKATIIYVTHDQTEAMTLGTRIVVLKDGDIMQVDSPQKLYNEPNNLFVAGFIGSPQMNFIDATCKVDGNKAYIQFENTSIDLPAEKAKKLVDGGYDGKTVIMGIRPEDVNEPDHMLNLHQDCVFDTTVTGYELLGSEVLLYYKVAGSDMTAKVDSRTTARLGSQIKLAIDPEHIHVFDKETELTITN
jgi:multiple sugar transport system ATP-binding protein